MRWRVGRVNYEKAEEMFETMNDKRLSVFTVEKDFVEPEADEIHANGRSEWGDNDDKSDECEEDSDTMRMFWIYQGAGWCNTSYYKEFSKGC